MRNLKYIFTILFFLLFNVSAVEAITPTPTVKPGITTSPTSQTLNEKLNSQINQLKDKIASRVTELNLVEKRGIIGVISETSSTQITLTDLAENIRQVDVDEITKFSSPSKTSFGLSDLTKGTKITVLGLYNKQSKRILARFINTSVDPVFLTGAVSDIDSKNITISIMSEDKKKTKIDIIQPSTKISEYNKTDGLTKMLFSNLNIGDRISIVGYPDKKNPALIVASRIIIFAQIPKNPQISIQIPTPTKPLTPSASTSAVKKPTPTIAR